ncbi:MAG TPA: hypothetical protein VFP56_09555 [Candidatus Limnocylindrales bacterium]|nr:hypothetical protein [Candidatus Limnocylindrales bacterium]
MTPGSAPAVRRELEPTHPCVRCGREGVPADSGLCELCNPLELSQPSATQMHGIAAVGILGFIVMLAVLGRVVLAGTGPFAGQVTAVVPAAGGLSVTLDVANEGSNASATTCILREAVPRFGAASQSVQTGRIAGGSSISFTTTVTGFGTEPIGLTVACGSQ